jgi:bifunctional oligoribonuclease and PAP phosphatase NrnA
MVSDDNLKKVTKSLQHAKFVLVISHAKPDGDTVGAALGLVAILQSLGKKAIPACVDPLDESLLFIPGARDYVLLDDNLVERITKEGGQTPDLLVYVDSDKASMFGDLAVKLLVWAKQQSIIQVINIDHHPTNNMFGTVNLVDVHAPSTASVIYKLVKTINHLLTPVVAQCLLAGVVSDTQALRTQNVNSSTLIEASELMRAGASYQEAVENLFYSRSPQEVKLTSEIASRFKQVEGSNVFYTAINSDDLSIDPDAESCARFVLATLQSIRNAKIVALFIYRGKDVTKVSLRSRHQYDISPLAIQYGGGGHKNAASFVLKETDLNQAMKLILPALAKVN